MKKAFLICPVRNATDEDRAEIDKILHAADTLNYEVYWPTRDTNQDDPVGLDICQANRVAIERADEVWVYWKDGSQGSIFDFGMAFAMGKPITLVGPLPERTPHKSFVNVLFALDALAKRR